MSMISRFSASRLFFPVMILWCQASIAQPESESNRWSVKKLIEFHQQIHPNIKAQDVYKLCYQASFGVEHILSDTTSVDSFLVSELQSLDSSVSGEPLLERISQDNEIVRVNLRPFKALNLNAPVLVKVMFQSARETIPDTVMFYRMWHEFGALVRFGLLKFSSDDLKIWSTLSNDSSGAGNGDGIESMKLKSMHHSIEYSRATRPAYRVVRRSIFEAAFGKMKQ